MFGFSYPPHELMVEILFNFQYILINALLGENLFQSMVIVSRVYCNLHYSNLRYSRGILSYMTNKFNLDIIKKKLTKCKKVFPAVCAKMSYSLDFLQTSTADR